MARLFYDGVNTIDVGTFGGNVSNAVHLNELGQVVGQARVSSGQGHAFVWEDGQMLDLGTFGGSESGASKINNLSQAVGGAQIPGGKWHAFIWTQETRMVDLNTLIPPNSEWELTGAVDNNDNGLIIGYGFINGQQHSFLLTPHDGINSPPEVGAITAPVDPVLVNTSISASATFTDIDAGDTHTATWDWGDGNTSAGVVDQHSDSVTGSHIYTAAGVYKITLTVTDNSGASGQSVFEYVVVYDPSAGFVTGGGWINSPAGAYQPNPTLSGKATFGFVSKYQKGANVPAGETQFAFHVASMNFKSSSYQWLVVAGAKAQYKGEGTINGSGTYGFMLTAIDGQQSGGGGQDKFRIKIWEKATGGIVYDNRKGEDDNSNDLTVIAGGSIVIHK